LTSAVSYARVSSIEQREKGLSIEAQIRFIRKYAVDHGLKIIREFIEVETAKDTGRPRFKEMVDFLENSSDCRLILVEKTDRLYRNLRDMIRLDDLGIDIHFTKEGAIVGPQVRSSDKFMHGIRVLMAKNYVDNLSEEVKKGMQEKVLRGEWPHRAPWGYWNQKELRKIEPDPVKSVIVKWLFNRYITGDISMKRLHKEYMTLGYEIPIALSYIRKILRDPFYKGEMRWKGMIYPAKHEALVDIPTWDTVQLILDASTKPPYAHKPGCFTYGQQLIKCGYCGCCIVAEIKKGRYIYYHCTEHHGPCKNNGWVRQELLDEQFLAEIQRMKMDDGEYTRRIEILRSLKEQERIAGVQAEKDLRKRIKELQGDLEVLYRTQRDRIDFRSPIKDQHDGIMEELSDLTERLKEIQVPKTSRYTEYEKLLDFSNRADKLFINGTIDIRRKVIEMLFDGIKMFEGRIVISTKIQPIADRIPEPIES
jgi:site-specific DNA recombinase